MASRMDTAQVLLIDDSELARELMTDLLEDAGIACRSLPSAIGATQLITHEKLGVVVTDVNMPTIPGNNLVSMLRGNPRTGHVKVALISELDRETLYDLGRRVHADGVIEKSRMDRDLVPLVRKLLHAVKHNTSPMSARKMVPEAAFAAVADQLKKA